MTNVIIIGGGPAGIAAAVTASDHGCAVMLIDEAPRPGGQIWRHVSRHGLGNSAKHWLHRLERSSARVLPGVAVTDIEQNADGGFVVRTSTDGAGSIHARTVIIATGAREVFLPFPGWTLPGVTGVGGGQALLKAGASVIGRRIIVAGSGPLLLPVAAALAAGGARVTHILEQAPAHRVARFALGLWRSPSRLAQAAAYRARAIGARYQTSTWVQSAHGTDRVHGATLSDGRRTWAEPCDMLCVGYGLTANTEVAQLLGCGVMNGCVRVDENMASTVPGVYAVGEATGVAGVDSAILEGRIAALAVAGKESGDEMLSLQRAAARHRAFASRMDDAFELRAELRQLAQPDTIVCRCEDVTLAAVARCESMREAKLHTRAGMGPCQGRVCAPALQLLFNWSGPSVRAPIAPSPVSKFITSTPAPPGGDT